MMMSKLFLLNDNLIKLTEFTDQITNALVSGASVSVKILNPDGTTLSTLTLTDVAGKPGDYQGTLASTVVLIEATQYEVDITVDAGASGKAHWRVPMVAEYQQS